MWMWLWVGPKIHFTFRAYFVVIDSLSLLVGGYKTKHDCNNFCIVTFV